MKRTITKHWRHIGNSNHCLCSLQIVLVHQHSVAMNENHENNRITFFFVLKCTLIAGIQYIYSSANTCISKTPICFVSDSKRTVLSLIFWAGHVHCPARCSRRFGARNILGRRPYKGSEKCHGGACAWFWSHSWNMIVRRNQPQYFPDIGSFCWIADVKFVKFMWLQTPSHSQPDLSRVVWF